MKEKLTDKQSAVLRFIEDHILRAGGPPTIREIGAAFKISSTNGVRAHLAALVKKGYLKKHDFLSRGLELTRSLVQEVGRVPVVGSVPAGLPIDAVENIEGELAIDFSFLPRGDSFVLKVTGQSMKDAGILDGDMVLVQKQNIAQNGDIVVAIINEEATVKRYFSEGRQVRLQPENRDFDPILVSIESGEFRIAGKVIGLLRRL